LEWKDRELANDKFAELKIKIKVSAFNKLELCWTKKRTQFHMDREKKSGRFVKWAGAKLLVSDHAEGPFHEISS
jgi:hypothetical protein